MCLVSSQGLLSPSLPPVAEVALRVGPGRWAQIRTHALEALLPLSRLRGALKIIITPNYFYQIIFLTLNMLPSK